MCTFQDLQTKSPDSVGNFVKFLMVLPKPSPFYCFPFSDQPFLFVAWENLPGVTVVSLPAAFWQRSLVPWEAFKIQVSAPSAVLVGAIAP